MPILTRLGVEEFMGWLLAILFAGLAVFLGKKVFEQRRMIEKYSPIINLDKEISSRKATSEEVNQNLMLLQSQLATLQSEVQILSDDHDLLSAGFYKPKYKFSDAKGYKEKLEEIRSSQKELIKAKKAIVCSTQWTVSGSKAEGKKMIDRVIKLGLAAFNVQCDNEIISVKFDNIDRSEAKLEKIRDNVNKLLEPNQCEITRAFFSLKLQELSLSYEYEEKLHKEREEQKQLREQMREEEKARRESERAEAEAERDERRYTEALNRAKQELQQKTDEEREAYSAKIAELEGQLREAHEKRERAKSMAEQTRRGHVYIISNIGSFGENIYKIGMTRRLDPMDRIWELGDASVPFDFDVHALVHSEDAPALEKKLHEQFEARRVNRVNERKEFFRVSLEEIATACKRLHKGEMKLTLVAEAKEYRQTLALTPPAEKKAA